MYTCTVHAVCTVCVICFSRHPVKYVSFKEQLLFTANIPQDAFPETDMFDNMVQCRYRIPDSQIDTDFI